MNVIKTQNKTMSNTNKKNNTKRKPRKKFLDVDVFRNTFGPVSEKAVYDVFQTIFKVEDHNMRKYTFPHCVQQLRKYKLQQQEKENK